MTALPRIGPGETYCPVCGYGGDVAVTRQGAFINHFGRPGFPCFTTDSLFLYQISLMQEYMVHGTIAEEHERRVWENYIAEQIGVDPWGTPSIT